MEERGGGGGERWRREAEVKEEADILYCTKLFYWLTSTGMSALMVDGDG